MSQAITWKRQPQEQDDTNYLFSGVFLTSRGIQTELSQEEVDFIVNDLLQFRNERGTIDYLQVYKNDAGRKIFCIDQLSKEQLEGGGYSEEAKKRYNYWTMLFAEEY